MSGEQIDDGGPAFPGYRFDMRGGPVGASTGLSLRAYIATAALQGILSADSPELIKACEALGKPPAEVTAYAAVSFADALLAELAK